MNDYELKLVDGKSLFCDGCVFESSKENDCLRDGISRSDLAPCTSLNSNSAVYVLVHKLSGHIADPVELRNRYHE